MTLTNRKLLVGNLFSGKGIVSTNINLSGRRVNGIRDTLALGQISRVNWGETIASFSSISLIRVNYRQFFTQNHCATHLQVV